MTEGTNANVLTAFINLINHTGTDEVEDSVNSSNTANQMGDSLETYVKDLFANSFSVSKSRKTSEYDKVFSYTGSSNNPPDMMLKNGDAIEVKKIASKSPQLQLNSSFPKDILFARDPRINENCRKAEEWSEKDMLYVVGHVVGEELRQIQFVYGNCFAASEEIYKQLADTISLGISNIPDITFTTETNELARVNKVAPLDNVALRVRGMWLLDNPIKTFSYLEGYDTNFANLLLLDSKYNSFPLNDRQAIENLRDDNFTISDVSIKNPNNQEQLINAKLLSLKNYIG